MTDILQWLQHWYAQRCDNDWEHGHGIKIETLDNPGWLVEADIPESPDEILVTQGEVPGPANGNVGGEIWMICQIRNNKFVGAGDPTQLTAILERFRMFVGL